MGSLDETTNSDFGEHRRMQTLIGSSKGYRLHKMIVEIWTQVYPL